MLKTRLENSCAVVFRRKKKTNNIKNESFVESEGMRISFKGRKRPLSFHGILSFLLRSSHSLTHRPVCERSRVSFVAGRIIRLSPTYCQAAYNIFLLSNILYEPSCLQLPIALCALLFSSSRSSYSQLSCLLFSLFFHPSTESLNKFPSSSTSSLSLLAMNEEEAQRVVEIFMLRKVLPAA